MSTSGWPGPNPDTIGLSIDAAVGAAQQAAIAASSAWNASYFLARTRAGSRARRVAAALLVLLFAGVALEALAGLPVADTSAEVVRRTPLLLATTGIAFLVSYRPHRAASPRSGDERGAR